MRKQPIETGSDGNGGSILVGNAQIGMARRITLKQLQSYAGDMLTDEALTKVQADLDKLPAKG